MERTTDNPETANALKRNPALRTAFYLLITLFAGPLLATVAAFSFLDSENIPYGPLEIALTLSMLIGALMPWLPTMLGIKHQKFTRYPRWRLILASSVFLALAILPWFLELR